MIVRAIRTERIRPAQYSVSGLLDKYVTNLQDGSVLAVTSKVVALCEKRIVPKRTASKAELVKREAELYLPPAANSHQFTIAHRTLIGSAGIDYSPRNKAYILLPADAQKTANEIHRHLVSRFGHKHVGVIITDSTSTPLRRGAVGVTLAHSGFKALKKYRDRHAGIAGGLTAAAVAVMGEGSEQTPLAIIGDLPFVEFQSRPPTKAELDDYYLSVDEDVFGALIKGADWRKGKG